MKPKEFDDLVRNKFDQNDFAYNPKNWDKLAEKLDGLAEKRSLMMWWWVPLTGIAASFAMAMGVTSLMRQQGAGAPSVNTEYAQTHPFVESTPVAAIQENVPPSHLQNRKITKSINEHAGNPVKDNTGDWFTIRLQNAITNNAPDPVKTFTSLTEEGLPALKKKTIAANTPHPTFKPEAEAKKASKLSIMLSGGVNHGNLNSGYIAGTTIRRMINDKVFVEGDLGFASSNNTQSTEYLVSTSRMVTLPAALARHNNASAKISSPATDKTTTEDETTSTIEQRDISYNLYYAQVTPSIGYKLMKRMSVGVGPDFQQMLVDNRPAPSTVDRSNIPEAPMFDVGFIGKTEYALTKKIKAGVYYRKGVNDLISPGDKYINRDYLQFQLKCVIFNK